jgi:hypothetical protein
MFVDDLHFLFSDEVNAVLKVENSFMEVGQVYLEL